MEYFAHYGYVGLFFASFLAATILPLSSEVVLALLIMNGLDPSLLVVTATSGNVMGAIVNYVAGMTGGLYLVRKLFRLSPDEYESACKRYKKFGAGSLFFSWVPVIGDPLTFVAGTLKINYKISFWSISWRAQAAVS